MPENRIENRQLWAWVITAMFAPLAAVAADQSWLSVGIAASVCAVLGWTVHRQIGTGVKWSKPFRVLQWIWAALALSRILYGIPLTWPQGEHPKTLVLILLAVALWTAWNGSESCSRTATTLSWLVWGLMAVVFLAAVKDVRVENVKPEFRVMDTEVFLILLIPCAAGLLPRRGGRENLVQIGAIAVMAVAVSFLVAGVISPALAQSAENPFYEMSRTLTLSGAAQRFEALVSAGMTVSWCTLLCLLLCIAREMADNKWGAASSAAAAAILYLCDVRINGTLLSIGGTLFWGILPVLVQGIGQRKKL